VVLNVAEDIEAKIRRLRELGKASAEPSAPPTKPSAPSPKKPPRRPRSLSTIRERERRKRILIGASIFIIIILIVSVGVYAYLQSRASSELKTVRDEKLKEVVTYFNGYNFTNPNCTKQVTVYKSQVVNKILQAKSIDELRSINVKLYFDKAVQAYEQCVAQEREKEYQKLLNETKQRKLQEIKLSFQPLLSMPLPDSIKAKVVSTLKSLEDQVNGAKTLDQVKAINPDPYLLSLWRDYYYYEIDSVTTPDVILEMNGVKRLVSKDEAKAILGSVTDYRELLQYRVYPVKYVEIALVLPRDRIAGGFIEPGDKVVFFATNGSQYQEIVNQGFVEMVLLPTNAGQISASESQSQSSSSSTSSSSTYSESNSANYNPGGTVYSNGTSYSDTYSNSQSAGQSSSASYTYTVNLAEILKAIAAGKIEASDEVKAQLESYGWKVLNLEEASDMLVMNPETKFLVIVKVPSIFVPDILSHQNNLYVAKVST
jgi:hypothetical protein